METYDDNDLNKNPIVYLPSNIVDKISYFLPIVKHDISSSIVAKSFQNL